ncbi:hypothetical protein ABVT39_002008 [Epinephelus coioides]
MSAPIPSPSLATPAASARQPTQQPNRTSGNLQNEDEEADEERCEGQSEQTPQRLKRPDPGTSTPNSSSKTSAASAQSSLDTAILEYLEGRKQQQEDELDTFFKSMATSMRKMPENTRAMLKFKIHELVHRAEMETMYQMHSSQASVWDSSMDSSLGSQRMCEIKSMAGEKPGASTNVLWGLFKFSFMYCTYYKSVKVYTTVHKLVCIELLLVMTDKTSSKTNSLGSEQEDTPIFGTNGSENEDQCDTCFAFKPGNISAATWAEHCLKKDTRAMKQKDKEEAGEKNLLVCMDLQGLLLCPKLQASALYYKTKLGIHNFTIFDMVSHDATNYLCIEGEAGLSANEFASCIVDYLEAHPELKPALKQCPPQVTTATEKQKPVIQKFLQRGHTQMECDSVHSIIAGTYMSLCLSLLSEYAAVIRGASFIPRPYQVRYVDHTFFMDFSQVNLCKSIQSGKNTGDPIVHDLRAIRYYMDGDWEPYPSPYLRRKSSITTVTPLYTSRQKIKQLKFKHLREQKKVLPQDFHASYDGLHHE